jgi:hypothetical protein
VAASKNEKNDIRGRCIRNNWGFLFLLENVLCGAVSKMASELKKSEHSKR